MKQVLLNLLTNALKFTPEGGRVDVRARVHDGAAEISVTDTGIGIAPEDQATVFEEFRQVGTASKKVEGTGLGLAISRKFIELHGGTIGVTSEPGAGSTFAFTLPLTRHRRERRRLAHRREPLAQRRLQHLAGVVLRQLGNEHVGLRPLEPRDALETKRIERALERCARRWIRRRPARDDASDDFLAPLRMRAADHRHLGDVRVRLAAPPRLRAGRCSSRR